MMFVTRLQAVTYLFGVCLFSISFLVFMNSSVSFVITDVLREKQGVGNAVGTLGFLDELVALVACPVWGVLSDRIGVRTVSFGLVIKPRTFLQVVLYRSASWVMPSWVCLWFFSSKPRTFTPNYSLRGSSLASEAQPLQRWSLQYFPL